MRAICCLMVVALSVLASPPSLAADAVLAPRTVSQMMDRIGPSATEAKLTDLQWKVILNGMRAGDPRWLAIAPRLRQGDDSKGNAGIRIAISDALRRHPEPVLRVLGAGLAIEDVCMDNDIEPKPDTVKAYYATTIPAVRAVSAKDIQPTRDACLDNLVKSRDGEQAAARR